MEGNNQESENKNKNTEVQEQVSNINNVANQNETGLQVQKLDPRVKTKVKQILKLTLGRY